MEITLIRIQKLLLWNFVRDEKCRIDINTYRNEKEIDLTHRKTWSCLTYTLLKWLRCHR